MRALVLCTTCRYSDQQQTGPDGRTGGETLIEHVETALKQRGREDMRVERQACLWSCRRHCNVLFRDDQRFSYLAGDLKPLRETAEAIIDWFDLHGSSEMGAVAFRRWPAAMRGRFIARFPPPKP